MESRNHASDETFFNQGLETSLMTNKERRKVNDFMSKSHSDTILLKSSKPIKNQLSMLNT